MSAARCAEILNTLIEFSCEQEFAEQMEIAREFFSIATGKVTDEDSFFESRMNLFQQWFLFDFRLSGVFSGGTIFELYLMRRNAAGASAKEIYELEQFRSVRRSLFRIEKSNAESVIARDIFADFSMEIWPLPETSLAALELQQVFEARVVNLEDRWYFSGVFVFHPEEVRSLIAKRVRDFLIGRTYDSPTVTLDWKSELKRRHDVLQALSEQKRILESVEKRKSIEVLNMNRSLAQVANEVGTAPLVMAIGSKEEVSAYVPETPFYDAASIMDALAYSELRTFRYRHIAPQKLYASDNREVQSASPSRQNVSQTR